MRSLVFAVLLAACTLVPLRADGPSVHGHVLDPTGLPLPGATVTLRSNDTVSPITTVTDADGSYALDSIPTGHYDLDASLDGFQPAAQRNLDITPDATLAIDLKLALAVVHQELTVSAPAPVDVIGGTEPNAPVTVTREVMDIAMLPNSQFDDVLPLMPNVLRGPDGAIAVAGARSASNGLFVNGLYASNPISGGPGLMLPLEAVDSMQVYAGGAPATFGQATGGITAVRTRSGTDQFHTSIDSFFPRLLVTDSGVRGVAFWDPNAGISGPIIPGRVTFQQALSYRYDRNSFTTLAGDDHNVFNALLTWSQVDVKATPSQRLRLSFAADPRDTDHANVTAFTPSASSPSVDEGGWSSGISDAIVAGAAVIELHASALRTTSRVDSSGDAVYEMGHELADGTYFDRQNRRATTVDGGATLTWSSSGHSVFTTGLAASRRQLSQDINAGSIAMLRSDDTVARTISFIGSLPAEIAATTVGAFVQDEWTPRNWLTLNAGLRYDLSSNADDAPPSPRVGWSVSRDHGRMKVSGSAGWFSDVLPLAAPAYASLPMRQIVTFEPDGTRADTTVVNTTIPGLRAPQALRWDVEADRNRGPWTTRVRYEERRGLDELSVNPSSFNAAGLPAEAVLSSSGSSRARSLEITSGFRSAGGNEGFVSFVHATTRGDSNSLDATEGTLRVPFVQINGRGPLPVDVPNRFLVWGVFQLPGRFTVAPFLDTRNGFPFTAIDDNWVMVGTPGAYRLPWMSSLDLSMTRIIGLPHGLPDARVGLKLYNIVSAHTEREVQRDIDRPDFGTAYDPVPRDFSFVFELLWGRRH